MAQFNEGFQREKQPWGYTQVVSTTTRFRSQYLTVLPGRRTSLHYHDTKVETLYVLEGFGYIEANGERKAVRPGDRVTIPAGEHHRIEAGPNGDLVLLQLASPEINDIVFVEDDYGRA
jgi:mannose-6-phosphate isomerase-like protein (cupin superfamily)